MLELVKSTFRIIKSVILISLLICLVVFLVDNRDNVTIHLNPLPHELETKLFVVIIFFFLFGLVFGLLLCSKNLLSHIISDFKNRYKIRKLEKRLSKNSAKSTEATEATEDL